MAEQEQLRKKREKQREYARRHCIKQKMALAGARNMSGYLLKMAIDGYVINLELLELSEGIKLLRYISNNVNQIARTMNSGGTVCPDEFPWGAM